MEKKPSENGVKNRESDGKSTSVTPIFDTNELLNYQQAADFLKVSKRTLRKWVADRTVPFVRLGVSGVRFRVSSLIRFCEEREIA